MIEQCLATQGISAIEGSYQSGKTSLVPLLAYSLLQVEAITKKRKNATKAAIEKKLAEDSDSDEDMYDYSKNTKESLKD